LQNRLEGRAILAEGLAFDGGGRDAARPCFFEAAGIGAVGITRAISAGKSSSLAALINAAMFDPRPEIRIATRRFMASPCETDLTM
jgi:hypothetical protein